MLAFDENGDRVSVVRIIRLRDELRDALDAHPLLSRAADKLPKSVLSIRLPDDIQRLVTTKRHVNQVNEQGGGVGGGRDRLRRRLLEETVEETHQRRAYDRTAPAATTRPTSGREASLLGAQRVGNAYGKALATCGRCAQADPLSASARLPRALTRPTRGRVISDEWLVSQN